MTTGVTVDEPRHGPRMLGRVLEGLLRRGFDGSTPGWAVSAATAAAFAGSGLMVATAAIHLHLWLMGYRHVPRLDVLFLAQAISGFLLGPIIAAGRHLVLLIIGAVFMASSAGGLILSATIGFVGIHDGLDVPWATPSLVVELAGFVLFTVSSAIVLRPLLRRD